MLAQANTSRMWQKLGLGLDGNKVLPRLSYPCQREMHSHMQNCSKTCAKSRLLVGDEKQARSCARTKTINQDAPLAKKVTAVCTVLLSGLKRDRADLVCHPQSFSHASNCRADKMTSRKLAVHNCQPVWKRYTTGCSNSGYNRCGGFNLCTAWRPVGCCLS